MKTIIVVLALVAMFGLIGYGFYRKGYANATAKTAADYNDEYGNDWKDDPSVKHSAIYSLAYSRGHAAGWAETRQKDFIECSEKLAQVVNQKH